MRAFHAFWSAPNRLRNGGRIVLADYELLTLMLSALKWQEQNGPIRMVTDRAGAAFFRRSGLGSLWSGSIDPSLERMPSPPDPRLFWAAGKLEALRRESAPCVMLDTDLILWSNVGGLLGGDVVAAHREALNPAVYPDPSVFPLDESFAFPAEWDFSLSAANTAFLYLPDDGLKTYYTESAFRFMRAMNGPDVDPTAAMCFAEQRLLPMCAKARGFAVRTLLEEGELDKQSFVTHLWGHKRTLAASPERRIEYCLGCALRLLRDFPEWEGVLAENEQLRPYMESL